MPHERRGRTISLSARGADRQRLTDPSNDCQMPDATQASLVKA
jgi:hypothetical protein